MGSARDVALEIATTILGVLVSPDKRDSFVADMGSARDIAGEDVTAMLGASCQPEIPMASHSADEGWPVA